MLLQLIRAGGRSWLAPRTETALAATLPQPVAPLLERLSRVPQPPLDFEPPPGPKTHPGRPLWWTDPVGRVHRVDPVVDPEGETLVQRRPQHQTEE